MATSTLKDVFSTTITDFFVNQVASHLSEWLKTNKSVDVSSQELCEVFNVPYTPRATMAGLPQSANMAPTMPNLPGYFSGTGASPARRGGRKKVPVDPNAAKCVYIFQRGTKKGLVCGEVAANNGAPGSSDYCKSCLKKKTVQNRITSGSGGRSTVQPPIVPGGMVPVADQPATATDNTINVVPIPGNPDMFKDVNHNFILKRNPDGSVVALSVEENGVQRNLTADEKKTAQVLGLSFVDSPQAVDQPVPTIPTVPGMTSLVPAGTQTVPSIPTVPSVPSATPVQEIPQMTVPVPATAPQVVPTIPSIPSVPQAVPQVVPQAVHQVVPLTMAQPTQ